MREIAGLAVTVEGDGPPVVLVHAGVADHRSWDGVAAALAPDHTVIRYDLRGFGASPPPTTGFRHRDDLMAVLDGLGVDRVAVAGNSFGGYVSLEFATRWPERVTHLALLAAPLAGWDWSPVMRDYGAAEEKLLDAGDLDGALALNLDQWLRGPVRAWSPALRELADQVAGPMRTSLANQRQTEGHELDDGGPGPAELFDRLTMPTLVGVGDADVPDFLLIARRLAESIPHARFIEFAGSGHILPLERPAGVATQLASLLSG